MNSDLQVSTSMIARAKQAFEAGNPLAVKEDYEIFQMPEGVSADQVMILCQPDKEIPDEMFPDAIVYPVTIEGRKGYILTKQKAQAFM